MKSYMSMSDLIVTGILTVLLIVGVLTGKKMPLVSGYRSATIVLFVLGILMCSFGTVGTAITKDLLSPFTIASIILGIIAFALCFSLFTTIKIPFISSDRDTFIYLAIIIASKTLLATIHTILRK